MFNILAVYSFWKMIFLNIVQPKSKSMKKLFSTNYSDGAFNFALLLLRITAGGTLAVAGYGKLVGFAKMVDQFPDPLHVGHSASLSLTIFAEFFCSLLVLVGLLTRLAAIPVIITMIVIFFIIWKGKFALIGTPEGSGATMSLLFLAMFAAIFFTGPGKISVDKLIGK